MKSHVTIGTRGSKLALWQANFVKDQLESLGVEVELKIISTKGDRIQHLSFDKIEGKGFFTKEIEDTLLRGDIDLAVHSMKDLPTTQPEGLTISAVSYRATPSDWLVICADCYEKNNLMHLKEGAKVGTSSARRKSQMLNFRPDVTMVDIRGNVPTRLKKLESAEFDAIILAGAGLSRLELDLSKFHVVPLNPKEFVPAPAQGVLALQTSKFDVATRSLLKGIHHSDVARCTNIERKILKMLNGGCHIPFGAYCIQDQMGNYHVWAAIANNWDAPIRRVHLSSATSYGLAESVFEALQTEEPSKAIAG